MPRIGRATMIITMSAVLTLASQLNAYGQNGCCATPINCPRPPFQLWTVHHDEFMRGVRNCFHPRPVRPACQMQNWGYYNTCWNVWPFPPNYAHCVHPPVHAHSLVPPSVIVEPEAQPTTPETPRPNGQPSTPTPKKQ